MLVTSTARYLISCEAPGEGPLYYPIIFNAHFVPKKQNHEHDHTNWENYSTHNKTCKKKKKKMHIKQDQVISV